jgi:hypothetical protein
MNKNINGLIAVAVVGLLGYLAYKKLYKSDSKNVVITDSKKVVINYLYTLYGENKLYDDFVNKADKGYIDNWSNAIMNGKDTFQFNGKIYNTKGGSAKP